MPEDEGVWVVLTADQIASRRDGDRVPEALVALGSSPHQGRAFARTAGDEIQGLFSLADEVVDAIEALRRLGGWRVGIGLGAVARPAPEDVRAASGPAFVAARQAIGAARSAPGDLAVVGPDAAAAERVAAALHLLDLAWRRRRAPAWEVARRAESGMTQRDMATDLGVTPSAVSQRMTAGAVVEVVEGKRLAAWLLRQAMIGAGDPG